MVSPAPDHQRQILKLLALVPYGCVVSYGQLADLAGLPGRARLVGRTLRTHNTEHLPWHRVIGAGGRLSLPKGSPAWREQKQRLLSEGVTFKGNAVSGNYVAMAQHQWQPDLAAMLMLFEE
ncbi:MAG: MGMT family protein [Oceanisphaera sp.]|uniref:MGMT family protein n=1 Tax=Oceanisphaera sp. TaxID=1929979 RepID=UPI003C75DBB2